MAATQTESIKKRTREMTIKDIEAKYGKGPYKLHLGCGSHIKEGFINIDIIEHPDILQLDLEVGRLPFPKGSVEEIQAHHIMEHLHEFPKLMNECHRVMKPGGHMVLSVPMYPSKQAFQDPTHVRFFVLETFYYFINGSPLYEQCGKSYGFLPWRRMYHNILNGWELAVKLDK